MPKFNYEAKHKTMGSIVKDSIVADNETEVRLMIESAGLEIISLKSDSTIKPADSNNIKEKEQQTKLPKTEYHYFESDGIKFRTHNINNSTIVEKQEFVEVEHSSDDANNYAFLSANGKKIKLLKDTNYRLSVKQWIQIREGK